MSSICILNDSNVYDMINQDSLAGLAVDASEGVELDDEHCLICLQQGCDSEPPCHSIQRNLFHSACLAKLSTFMLWRCPHCNIPIMTSENTITKTAECRLRDLFNTWPSFHGPHFWSRSNSFLPLQEAEFMTTDVSQIAFRTLCRLARITIATTSLDLKGVQSTEIGLISVHNSIEVKIIFERAAIIGQDGRILWDGFEVSASRRRISLRLAKPTEVGTNDMNGGWHK